MTPRLRHRFEYALLRLTVAILRLVPFDVARRIGEGLGTLGWRLGIRRQVVDAQVAAAFPEFDRERHAAIARGSYANLGRVAIELALLPHLGRKAFDSLFEPESDLHVVQALLAGEGRLIACSGHVGNWELTGAFLSMHGIPVDAVARHMANPLLDGYLLRTRSRTGMRVLFDTDSVSHLIRGIKEGRVAGLLADQGVLGLASTYVPFFGRPARTPRGPAVLALRLETPVVFCAAVRQPGGKYRFLAREIAVAQTGDREADVEATVVAFTRALEELVRQYPDQYFWQHRRWKRQPADTPPALRDPVALATTTSTPDDR
ncbi:MAG: lysophospholipid acyltransferase family protein [Gemmatimonadaceae bacterium]|nr:lysophospholipid acyltransferase family protein [Gemmatimonadaceae bacterium]